MWENDSDDTQLKSKSNQRSNDESFAYLTYLTVEIILVK